MSWTPDTPRPVAQQYLADARAAGRSGITATGQAEKHGVSRVSALEVLHKMADRGEIEWRVMRGRGKGHRLKTFFVPGLAPKAVSVTTSEKVAVKLARKAVGPAGDVEIAPDVKITRAEPFVDRRFAFEPPPGWVGQITRDWRERRLQECGK